jgi:hypothetical protein
MSLIGKFAWLAASKALILGRAAESWQVRVEFPANYLKKSPTNNSRKMPLCASVVDPKLFFSDPDPH